MHSAEPVSAARDGDRSREPLAYGYASFDAPLFELLGRKLPENQCSFQILVAEPARYSPRAHERREGPDARGLTTPDVSVNRLLTKSIG